MKNWINPVSSGTQPTLALPHARRREAGTVAAHGIGRQRELTHDQQSTGQTGTRVDDDFGFGHAL